MSINFNDGIKFDYEIKELFYELNKSYRKHLLRNEILSQFKIFCSNNLVDKNTNEKKYLDDFLSKNCDSHEYECDGDDNGRLVDDKSSQRRAFASQFRDADFLSHWGDDHNENENVMSALGRENVGIDGVVGIGGVQ